MKETTLFHGRSKNKIVFAALFYVACVVAYTSLNVLNQKNHLYQNIDRQLEEAALTTTLLLPSDYHHNDMQKGDLTEEALQKLTLKLSKYTDNSDIVYVYTVMLQGEDVLFGVSSLTAEERQSDEKFNFYLKPYDDVDERVLDIFNTKEKVFLEHTDQWGTFRSIFIPNYSQDGMLYLSVADISISDIESLLNHQVYRSILIALLFLLFAYPLYYVAIHRLKSDAKILSQEVKLQTQAFKISQNKIVSNQELLLKLAKENFLNQQEALEKIISSAAKQLGVARVSVWLFDEEKTTIQCQVMYDKGELLTPHSIIKADDYPSYFKAINEAGFISADDAHVNPATAEFLGDYLLPNDIRSMMDAPIFIQGDIVGLMCCEQTEAQRAWSREDEEFVRSISDLCAQVFLNEQRKKAEELLNLQAYYDELTKLPNRVLFADRFSQAVAYSKRNKTILAICFIDLDNFKPVNDTHGHEAGDQLLIEVASRIKNTIRDQDTVSRQGGDEFTLLLGNLSDVDGCKKLLTRISFALRQPYVIAGQPYKISASIGTTLYPNDAADLDTLIRHADQAMYQAKLAGKNQIGFFNPTNIQEIAYKQTQFQEMKQAFTNNEFRLYYQPKVNMKTGDVFGAEALIRWVHPEKGVVLPLEFLPLLEGRELEIDLGNWVISEALQQLTQWQQQGIDVEISVNISSYHLQSSTFFDHLKSALAQCPSVRPEQLQLEILESSILGDIEKISGIIESCQAQLGVKIALDDFGTGYSSLTHIRNLSANVIKIDQSFVRDLLVDPDDYSIIEGVIGLAKAFNQEVIAEGVETDDQGLMLLMMGCDEAQGYNISRPLPAEDVPTWLANYTPSAYWLGYDSQVITPQEQKIVLLQLTTKHWFQYILSSLNDETIVTNLARSHLSVWFNRLKQDKGFNQDWLNILIKAHDSMFNLASALINTGNTANSPTQAATLKEFKVAYRYVEALLQSQSVVDVTLDTSLDEPRP